jgi:hypothetical protein
MYLNNVKQLSKIEWGKEWLWDIKFPDAPSPFNNWFPATDVTIPTATLKSKTFVIHMSEYSIPERTGEHKLSISFVDDINHTLLDWITAWINGIVDNTQGHGYVLTLQEAMKQVFITRLNTNREPILIGGVPYEDVYWVYPEGTPRFKGGGGSKSLAYEQDFVIVGDTGLKYITNMQNKGILPKS